MPKPTSPLLFVDTNIFLDFYRMREDSGMKLLRRLDSLHSELITTYQVEMEFKRNRQRVILEFHSELKNCVRKISAPAFLAETKTNTALSSLLIKTEKQITKLRQKLVQLLESPSKDPVLKATESLFANSSPLNLRRENEARSEIKRRAAMRFGLGYPPRKSSDTSMGDAFNWEWMLRCVEDTNRDVIVVSRDADYGITVGDASYPNDWLAQEIKERTKQTRKFRLVDRLSKALKLLKIEVSPEEIKQEDAVSAKNALLALAGKPRYDFSKFRNWRAVLPDGFPENLPEAELDNTTFAELLERYVLPAHPETTRNEPAGQNKQS